MDKLDQELACEALEYACFLDCGPVVFWLLYKYFKTDPGLNHLSAICKKRVFCQLLYWVVKDSKVGLFSQCLTILRVLKDDHLDLCHQKDWIKLELGIKLKIVLQQILNGSSQSQCLNTFYEQFPDFEEDKTDLSNSEEHMIQLLFQLIQRPSVVATNLTFQNEVGSKLIHAIRHRVKHLMVNLNQTLPQPQLEKARLDMWCSSGKLVKDVERFSEKKKKFCEFLQKKAKPTSQQIMQFLEGNDKNELTYDQKVVVVERIWYSIPDDLRSFAKSISAIGNNRKRTRSSIPIMDKGKSKEPSFYCQEFVDTAKETTVTGSSRSLLKSSERITLQHKSDTTVPSVTRLRSSSLISKRGRDDSHVKSAKDNFITLPLHAPEKSRMTAPDSTQHGGKGHHEEHGEKNVDFLAEFRKRSDQLRGQVDDVRKLINECINSNSVVELKRFKSPESLALYGKQEDKNCSAVARKEHFASEEFSENCKSSNEKEGFPVVIVSSDSEDSRQRFSSRLRETKKRNAGRHDDPVSVSKDISGTERLSRRSDSSLSSSSQSCPGSVSRSGNLNQSRYSVGEDFTECRENDQCRPDISERVAFDSRNYSEIQKFKQKGGGNNSGTSLGGEDVYRKRRRRGERSPEEKETRALTSDSDGKESSEEMIVVGSSYSQSFRKVYGKGEDILGEKADKSQRNKSMHSRRRLRSTTAYRQVEETTGTDPDSPILDEDVIEIEKAKRESRLSGHQQMQSLKSPNTLENVSVSRDSLKEGIENTDVYERSPVSTHKVLNKLPGNGDKQLVNASPVFEYKHSSGSSSDKSVSLLTGRRILFNPDDELIPNVSIEVIPEVSQENISEYPIDFSELASLPERKKSSDIDDSVRLTNSSSSHISSVSEVNSDQVRVISETPPDSPDGNLNNASPLEVSPSGSSLMLQKSEDLQSDSSSLQHAQRQQTHSFSKSSSDDIHHVSDSEDEEDDSLCRQNSENHPRFPSLLQYLNNEAVESPLRSCSIILRKIKLDKLRLRVLLSQDSQEKS